MRYLSLDHQLLTRRGKPWEGVEPIESILHGEAERFPIPWAPEWLVLRDARFTEYPRFRDRELSWRPRAEWPAPLGLRYEEEVLLGKLSDRPYTVWAFGYTPELADELLALVLSGKKTATCGSLASYEEEGEAIPKVGDLSVITDSKGIPGAVIRTVEAAVKPFAEVDAQFAYDEGEGDRSYEFWRSAHESYFTSEAAAMGGSFSDQMPLVCERFELISRFEEA